MSVTLPPDVPWGRSDPGVELAVSWLGDEAVVFVAGELDHTGQAAFEETLRTVADRRPSRVVVDASSLAFIGAGGLDALGRASIDIRDAGGEMHVLDLRTGFVQALEQLAPGRRWPITTIRSTDR